MYSDLTLVNEMPVSDVTTEQLRASTGGFWTDIAPNQEFLAALNTGELLLANNALQKVYDAADLRSLITAPLYYVPTLQIFGFKLSELEETAAGYTFPLPTNLVSFNFCTNNPETLDTVYLEIVDIIIDTTADTITFVDNPFEDTTLTTTTDDTDTIVWVWAFSPQFDYNYLYNHYGFVLGINGDTSFEYKQLLQIIWNATVGGTSRFDILKLLALAYDIELVDEEPTVDNWDVLDCADGTLDSRVYCIHVPASFLSNSEDYTGELIFYNTEVVPTIAGGDISWDIEGDAADVARFWDTTRYNETINGTTVLDMLTAAGEDTTTVNPAELLIKYFLANNTLLLLKPATMIPTYFGTILTRMLRRILPPWTGLLIADCISASPSPSPSP